jgi:glycosyltransferase involved in cell wall biosynthesis
LPTKMAAERLPIKICFIAPKAYPLFNPQANDVVGGAEVDLYFLATELAKDKDFSVSFITADYGQAKIETVENVRIIKSLDLKKNPLNGALKVWRAMKRADAHIYILKTASPGVPLAALFCRLNNRIFVYRTASTVEYDGTYHRQHFFLGRAFDRALRQARVVFAQNASDKAGLERTIGRSVVVIPNGHSLGPLQQYRRETVLWAGRSDKLKQPEVFVELARNVPDRQFVMICQQAAGDKNYGSLVARAKAVGNLKFVEYMPFHEIDAYFQQAKVFVNTSWAEGFPNTFIQAGKWATAILSLNVNPDGFLDEHNCGICCKGDVRCLADSLRYILDGGRYVEFGKNARSYVEKNHDITNIAQRYKELLRKLV